MARTLVTVSDYVQRATRLGAGDIRIVATSAVREARNGRAFADAIEHATGRRVDIVSGEEEAPLTIRGVRYGLGPLPGLVLSFDIGGGSTEYVLSEGEAIHSMVSLRLGVVPLTEKFPFPGVVDDAGYARLLAEVRDRLAAELPDVIRGARVGHLVGTAGTVTTLAALDLDSSSTIPSASTVTSCAAPPSSACSAACVRSRSRSGRHCRVSSADAPT